MNEEITGVILMRFYAKIILGDCWVWNACKDKYGYGWIKLGKKTIAAHRLSYMIHNGDIGSGMHVLHTCDNPSCVNPAHLFLGTHIDNMEDMKKKGRWRGVSNAGENNPLAKLSANQVAEIRKEIASGHKYKDVALKYCISDGHARKIAACKSWREA